MATTTRRPFVNEIVTVTSPVFADTSIDIKRCGVREDLLRMDLSSTIRYKQEDTGLVQERDLPMGSLRLETIKLAVAGWNIVDDNGQAVPVTGATLVTYLDPREFDWLYDQVLIVNPMWASGGKDDTKND